MTFKVGLTGGIGAGKSMVADHLERLGAQVVDTDILAREVVAPGAPALAEIEAAFPGVVNADGVLDRSALRMRVFGDEPARKRLEAIIHPRARALLLERLALPSPTYHLLVSPILFETGQDLLVDETAVVDVPEDLQRQRAALRDGASGSAIARIMASQWPRADRLTRATYVLDNSGEPEATLAQAETLHRLWLSKAAQVAGS